MLTPQSQLVALGVGAGAIAKFYFHKETMQAITIGLAAITVWSLLTAHKDKA